MIKINNKGSFAIDVSIVILITLSIFAFVIYSIFSITKGLNDQKEKLQASIDASRAFTSSILWKNTTENNPEESKFTTIWITTISMTIFIFVIFWGAFFIMNKILSINVNSGTVPNNWVPIKTKRKYVRKVPYNSRTNSGKTKLLPHLPLKASIDPEDAEYVIIKGKRFKKSLVKSKITIEQGFFSISNPKES